MSTLLRIAEYLRYRAAQAQRSRWIRSYLERHQIDYLSRPTPHGIEDQLAELCGYGGVFFEAGAADGYSESTTYFLERFRNCTGVLVEPTEQWDRCREERPRSHVVRCALVAPEIAGQPVEMVSAGLMSLVKGSMAPATQEHHLRTATSYSGLDPRSIRVIGKTISQVLDGAGVGAVDLMTLDLEGYEAEALRGLDLSRHAPRYLLVELLDAEVLAPKIGRVLGNHYAPAGWLTRGDFLYVRRGERVPQLEVSGALAWRPDGASGNDGGNADTGTAEN